jgi:hypothetical protein
MRKSITVFLFAVFAAVTSLPALAAPITVPSGLNPGDQYRLAFVSSTTRDATSTDIADYNAFVTTAANSVPELVALGTTWNAIASVQFVDARDNTGTNPELDPVGVPIYDLASQIIASSNLDLWDTTIQYSLSYQEEGNLRPVSRVWTGTAASGFASLPLGGHFPADPNDSPFALQGSTASGTAWIVSNVAPRNQLFSLYAMSDVLTVVPEPSSIVLTALGFISLASFGWRRKRRPH